MKKLIAMVMAVALALSGAGALAAGTLTVQGKGTVRTDADRATISMGVRQVAEDVLTAQSAVNEQLEAVIAALTEAGVERDALSTDGIGIYPNYDYSDEERIIGYTAYNNISVTVKDVDNVGTYIDLAFSAGANSLDYVSFSADDTAEAADQALRLAVESAKERAGVLAEAAGVELGEILEISDSSVTGYDSFEGHAKSEEADAGAGTPVIAAPQTVSATVTVRFAID